MHYLAEACSSSQKRGDDQRIEKRALASNPIMEVSNIFRFLFLIHLNLVSVGF